MLFMSCIEFRFYPCEIQSFAVWLFVCSVRQLRQIRQVIYHRAVRPERVCNSRRFCFCFLGAAKHLYKRVRPSVGPLRLLIFGGFGVLRSTAWPVLALVKHRINTAILHQAFVDRLIFFIGSLLGFYLLVYVYPFSLKNHSICSLQLKPDVGLKALLLVCIISLHSVCRA